MSYGDWSVLFWNWLLSDQSQGGTVCFLRGNVDFEQGIVNGTNARIKINSDTGIFFPIICSIEASRDVRLLNKLQKMRKVIAQSQVDPRLLRVIIDDIAVPHLRNYYVETPLFTLDVHRTNLLRKKFHKTLRQGKALAVSAGYWVLLRSLPVGKHRIRFKGIHRDGFETSGDYLLQVANRSG